MAQNVVGFVGLDEVSLELASSLLRSGYSVQAFEVCLLRENHLFILLLYILFWSFQYGGTEKDGKSVV